MNRIYILLGIFTLLALNLSSQKSYTSYFTGDEADVSPQPTFGITLMGGAGENDEAMKWFLERANGGDVVVIRASGSDGYNEYMFNELGVEVNSVETIVFNNADASTDPYVIEQVQNAEAIWMAGGDQWNYVSFWQGTAIEDAINNLLNNVGGPVGGTSAGMAVLGGSYFSAMNGTVYSDEALEDPYNQYMQLGHGDFLEAPFLDHVVTDTHYDDPDRRARHMTFMARMYTDEGFTPLGIACDEYTSVCVDENGIAWCYGEYPDYDDFAYFLRPNCEDPMGPEVCQPSVPLHWDRNNEALKVYRVASTLDGDKFFDLNDWLSGSGGEWQNWWVYEGEFNTEESADPPECSITGVAEFSNPSIEIWPNPSTGIINVNSDDVQSLVVFNLLGDVVYRSTIQRGSNTIDLTALPGGVYFVEVGGGVERIVIQ